MEVNLKTNYISTSHLLANELKSKPDGFILVKLGEEEYVKETILMQMLMIVYRIGF